MASFQILNSENKSLSISVLDAEAATFWNKPIDIKQYTNPTPPFVNTDNLEGRELLVAKSRHFFDEHINWFDYIGFNIANSKEDKITWDSLSEQLVHQSITHHFVKESNLIEIKQPLIDDDLFQSIYCSINYLKPYIALIKHWKDKGYTPKTIK